MGKIIDWLGTLAPLAIVTVIYIVGYALSWIVTCGLVKLVTMCFGWTFSWPIATGIWLIMCLAKAVFCKK